MTRFYRVDDRKLGLLHGSQEAADRAAEEFQAQGWATEIVQHSPDAWRVVLSMPERRMVSMTGWPVEVKP